MIATPRKEGSHEYPTDWRNPSRESLARARQDQAHANRSRAASWN
nr:MAG TPA: hypothetical protein [Caudoviricetes sp.]